MQHLTFIEREVRLLNLPFSDVAAAEGWKDMETPLTCYQQADTQTLIAVTAEERKIHEEDIWRTMNG